LAMKKKWPGPAKMGGYLKIYSQLTPQELRQLKYKEKYKKINPAWDDSLILLCRLFKPYLVPKIQVLDAGCGHGNLIIDEYREKIDRAVGVDISREATSKNVCLDKVVIANLEKLPFKDRSFDVVLGLWVLEHLSDPRAVFNQIYRVLKKDGAFIFVTPNKNSYPILAKRLLAALPGLTQKIFKKLYGREEEDIFGTYYRANTRKEIEKLIKASGFKKIKLFYNGDPSYLAFNDWLFYLGVWLDRLPQFNLFPFAKPHLIGVLEK
jgi:ubiquinone/menaquinone biosynthesis C-methylase UbiE